MLAPYEPVVEFDDREAVAVRRASVGAAARRRARRRHRGKEVRGGLQPLRPGLPQTRLRHPNVGVRDKRALDEARQLGIGQLFPPAAEVLRRAGRGAVGRRGPCRHLDRPGDGATGAARGARRRRDEEHSDEEESRAGHGAGERGAKAGGCHQVSLHEYYGDHLADS